MAKGYCIECDTPIKLGNSPVKGLKVSCPKCGAYLQVVAISPIELDWEYDMDMDYYWSEGNEEEGDYLRDF
jgi:lysine biosynthesis protein LysW